MVIQRFGLLCILGLGLIRCDFQNKFSSVIDVSTEIVVDDLFISRPLHLELYDDWLVWMDDYGGFFYSGYNLKKSEDIRFVKKGKGKFEYRFWPTSSIYAEGIGMYSHLRKFFQEWNPDSIANSAYFPDKTTFNDSLNLTLNVIRRNDSSFISTGIIEDALFAFFDKNGQFVKLGGDYPDLKPGVDRRVHAMASLNSTLAYHPKKDKLIYAHLFGAQMGVYSFKNQEVKQEWWVNDWPFEYLSVEGNVRLNSKKTKYGYIDVTCTDKYVYALFADKSISRDDSFYSDRVEVYDWAGEPVAELILDTPISHFAVSDDDKVLYGMAIIESDLRLIKGKLSL